MEMSFDGALNLRDVAASRKEKDKNDGVAMFIDLMMTRSDIYEDLVYTPCNEGRSHVVHYRTGLPKATWTRLYGGVESSKGSEATSRITTAEVESKLELDKRILSRYPTEAKERLAREVKAHADTINLAFTKAILFGDKRENPDSFNGLATIYNEAGGTNPEEIAFNCISAGGEADASLGSMFLVGHGTEGFQCLYPQGHESAGLEVTPLKEEEVCEVGNAKKTFRGLVQHFSKSGAAFVADWKACARYCNIDRNPTFASIDAKKEYAMKVFADLSKLTTRVKDTGVKQCWYVDKLVFELLKELSQAITWTNAVKEADVAAHKCATINGIPVRFNDAQLVDETFVG